jgi:hypothetical protein
MTKSNDDQEFTELEGGFSCRLVQIPVVLYRVLRKAIPRRAPTIDLHRENIILADERNKFYRDEGGRNLLRGRDLAPCTGHSYKLLELARSEQCQLPARHETFH